MSGLTVASQDEVLVLVQALLDELAAFPEGKSAARVFAEGLHGELEAGDALRDVLHAQFAALSHGAVSRRCAHTQNRRGM